MAGEKKRRKLSNGDYEALQSTADGAAAGEESTATPAAGTQKDQRRSLFVRSLAPSITTERLAEYFSQSYPLKHATVVLDPQTKTSRGFGFVTFADAEDAQAAAAEFNDSKLDGKKIKVEVAEARNREDGLDVAGSGGKRSKVNKKAVELRAQREQAREAAQPPRLIVRNLPWSIKEPDDLALLFRSFGKVKHVVLPKKGPRAQSGFGFVVLRGKKNAEKAIQAVNGKEVDGRTLAVDWAVDKKTWEQLHDGELGEDETNGTHQLGKDATSSMTEAGMDPEDDEDVGEEEGPPIDAESDSEIGEDEVGPEALSDDDHKPSSEPETDDASSPPDDTTIFIRNVPFTATDSTLSDHFSIFGAVRYARIVIDAETDRPRGTGFVAFYEPAIAASVVKNAPKPPAPTGTATANTDDKNRRRGETTTHSLLQDESADPAGRYTLDGRILLVSRALDKATATQRANAALERRSVRDHDKRRLYLLAEGNAGPGSALHSQLGKAELDLREASTRQRRKLVQTNPNLCVSLTRLSVRNVPRSVDSVELKRLAREAVVGFATEVKEGMREGLSSEEKARGGEAMRLAERRRKEDGKGIVRQAKIVFEGREGGKVRGETGGRSRGYGFIEYVGHRHALMGLRWLNGRPIKGGEGEERRKRLIVEFAIENAQVVQRRGDREDRAREWKAKEKEGGKEGQDMTAERRGSRPKSGRFGKVIDKKRSDKVGSGSGRRETFNQSTKRKRDATNGSAVAVGRTGVEGTGKTKGKGDSKMTDSIDAEAKNKLAKRNRIIAKKRGARKARK